MVDKDQHTRRWTALPERGTPAALRLIHWTAGVFGRSVARLILFPTTLYFLLSAHAVRRVSYEYLARVRGRTARCLHVFRHLYYFAATLLDRVCLMPGTFNRLDI